MNCRFCNTKLRNTFIDLGFSPPSNSYLSKEKLNEPEINYPLKLFVCNNCFLVQIDEYKNFREIFSEDYIYFSSYSTSWLNHAKRYVDMITERLNLSKKSMIIEIASNDGYLLQYFVKKDIPCIGIEPAKKTAEIARSKGIKVITEFFDIKLAKKLVKQKLKADLIIGNNVLAHVPDVNEFVESIKSTLKNDGVATLEFPHLMRLIEGNQFDTIYHEHFSYFSFNTVKKIFEVHGLEFFDVEELTTHGGSLRIYVKHQNYHGTDVSYRVNDLLEKEKSRGMDKLNYYENFQFKVDNIKYELLNFLITQRQECKKVIAYGAAAKGNTLLNYCGIKKDLIPYVVDASPFKQGNFLPCSHIPITSENIISNVKPDYILILPWNIKDEIITQLKYIRQWGGRFAISIPNLQIIT